MGVSELSGDDIFDEKSRTFVFEGEDHTLGRSLQTIISSYSDVVFCGYAVPHPDSHVINFRIQTSGPKAVDVLMRGLKDLEDTCSQVICTYEGAVSNFKKNSLNYTAEDGNDINEVHEKNSDV